MHGTDGGNMRIFKPYSQENVVLKPINVDYMIPDGHLVRVVSEIVDRMALEDIYARYKGGGATAYDPRMMIKVIIYAYMTDIYTSRKIARALRENMYFWWLSGDQQPNHATINTFRLTLREHIEAIFKHVVKIAVELGLVTFEDVFVDGTKVEANANRHKMVWRKNVERQLGRIDEKLDELLVEIEKANAEEGRLYGSKDLPEVGEGLDMDSEEVQEKISSGIKLMEDEIREKAKPERNQEESQEQIKVEIKEAVIQKQEEAELEKNQEELPEKSGKETKELEKKKKRKSKA